MKKSILLATSAFVALGATAANAVDVDMYGQVNKGIFAFDNGDDVNTNFVDNDRSSTRFGVRGSQALDNGLTASVLFEGEMQSNPSNTITGGQEADGSGSTFTERHSRVGLAGNWGAVFLGKTSTATDGITEIDMTGASDVMGSDIDRIGGGTELRDSDGIIQFDFDTDSTGDLNATLSSVWDNFDGASGGGVTRAIEDTEAGNTFNGGHDDRLNSVRYDSPIFNGFQARVATAQGGVTDGAILYNGKVDAFEVKAGLGYVGGIDGSLDSSWSGSASVKHNSGLAGTVAYGLSDLEDESIVEDDPQFYYVKLGYGWDQFEVAADYGLYQADLATGVLLDGTGTATTAASEVETSSFGLGGQYNVGNGVSLGALYRYVDADLDQVDTEEQSFYGVNMRVKF